jgi:FdhD protein
LDTIAKERTFTLFINGREMFTMLCSPGHTDELALGFLFSEGLVRHPGDIADMLEVPRRGQVFVRLGENVRFDFEELSRYRTIGSGCARGLTLTRDIEQLNIPFIDCPLLFTCNAASSMMSDFLQLSEGHRATGCIHAAALCDGTQFDLYREDIGRHNAVDKVLGAALAAGIPLCDRALFVSGRLSSEMLLKAARCGVPLVATRTAVTETAVTIAHQVGITLLGFVRPRRLTIFAHPWRIAEARDVTRFDEDFDDS